MQKTGKILLAILSWFPFAWTITILTGSILYESGWHPGFSLRSPLKDFLLLYGYLSWGLLLTALSIWLVLLILLTWKKAISKKRCVFYVIILWAGVLFAYLSLKNDLFCVSGCFLD
jgi:hypothetical protein